MSYSLEVNNLCKTYKDHDFKLDNIHLKVPTGSIVGFVGKNGAGKSTTINALLNMIQRDSGSIKFFGKEMLDLDRNIRNDIGVVFDSINFSGELTPIKLEKVLSEIYDYWNREQFFKYMNILQIPTEKKIKEFSRGMSMKLSICVALSHNAKLLILDEATGGLDPVIREVVLDLFLEFVENENHSIFISSHISSELEKIADYITFINDGKIILTEKKDTLIYEYGIARMKEADFEKLQKCDYLNYRKRGLQIEVLVTNKNTFTSLYPDIIVDNSTIDEILSLLTMEVA